MLLIGRPCYEVHGACDNRINLYPAAPIRLAKVLLAWTIAQEGWGSSFERQIGKCQFAMQTYSHTSDLPDTPDWGVSELSALSTLSRKGRSLRNQTLLEITPEGNGELARDGDDHDALNAPVLPFGPLHKPLGNRALGLMFDPQPSHLDHGRPHRTAAGARDPLRALHLAAVIRAGSQSQKACHLASVAELTIDAMSRTKAAVVFQQSPSSKSLLDVKEIPANGSRN